MKSKVAGSRRGFITFRGCSVMFVVFSAILFTSCSPANKLKRAKRLIAEAVAAGAEVKNDTVYTNIQFIAEAEKVDTVVSFISFRDTLRIETERIRTKIKVDTVTRTVFLEQEVKRDTVVIRVPMAVQQDIKPGRNVPTLILWVLIGFVTGLIIGLFARVRNHRNSQPAK
jgi:hypothetical protein